MLIRRTLITLAAIASLATAQACGPDFGIDTFVRTDHPDLPQQYVAGHLGILHADFPSATLFAAYRYLSGGTLSAAEQKDAYTPTDIAAGNEPTPAVAAWIAERAKYSGSPLTPPDPELQVKITDSGYTYNATVPNCADDAFRTAITTLQSRSTTWGKTSATFADWLSAQDTVFDACHLLGALPRPAPASAPPLLQQDRRYQIAAAQFYNGRYDEAAASFRTVAADKASPWQPGAGYLAGRSLIRKAFAAKRGAQAPADFDPATMQQAATQLRAYLATNPPPQWHSAAQDLLNLIRIRTETPQRTRELAAALTGPQPDENYNQDVQDILWIFRAEIPNDFRSTADGVTPEAVARVNAARDKAFADTANLRAAGPILDWSLTIRSLAPAAATHALEMWKSTKQQPWLTAALMLAPDNATTDTALLQAAAAVPTTSPAYQTVAYHRARLQLAAGNAPAARATLAALQSQLATEPQPQPSTKNAIQSLEARASATLAEFLTHLPQTTLELESENHYASLACTETMKVKSDWHHCLTPGPQDLDADAARILNEQTPLTLWLETARSQSIPQPLRQAIAMQGWTRATLLGNTAAAAAFQPLLPQPLQQQLAATSPLTPWVALARNPGLQPHLDPGVQRAYTYDFVESYRDNWCYNPALYATTPPAATALTPADRAKAAEEAKTLNTARSVHVGNRIIAAVAANPQDPQAPESLYLVLRMIRYGCNAVHEPNDPADPHAAPTPDTLTGNQLLKLRRDTAALMRRYYATNQWTKKAAPFVGEVRPPANSAAN